MWTERDRTSPKTCSFKNSRSHSWPVATRWPLIHTARGHHEVWVRQDGGDPTVCGCPTAGASRTEEGLVPRAHLDRGRAVPGAPNADVRRGPARRLGGCRPLFKYVSERSERDRHREHQGDARDSSEPPASARGSADRQPPTRTLGERLCARACVWCEHHSLLELLVVVRGRHGCAAGQRQARHGCIVDRRATLCARDHTTTESAQPVTPRSQRSNRGEGSSGGRGGDGWRWQRQGRSSNSTLPHMACQPLHVEEEEPGLKRERERERDPRQHTHAEERTLHHRPHSWSFLPRYCPRSCGAAYRLRAVALLARQSAPSHSAHTRSGQATATPSG